MPVSVVITGMDKPEILQQALEAVKTFKPLTADQVAAIREKTRAPGDRRATHEKFKTTSHFDSTAKHPEWLG